MQVLQDNFFYHSNTRLGADGGPEDERQLLVEEQKLCRARARKFSLETNRRRKALQERQKQWDVQEQRLRQNILQLRRQRVQDATERFQRAHLPPSQRCRQSFRKNVPNIEDALNQIQGKLSSYSRQSSFLSSNSNVSRSCTPSPKPPTVSQASYRQALSAVEAYSKLLQEQSMTCFKNSQQIEKTQQKQQDRSPQDSHLSDWCNSESLSSKDSLENEDPNHSTKNLQCSHSSFPLDSDNPHPGVSRQNYVCTTSDLTSFSATMLLDDNLPQSRKLHEHKQKKQADSERRNNTMHASKASWGFTSVEQTPKREPQPAQHNGNLITLSEIISADPEHLKVNSPQNITNGIAPGNTALQSSCPKQEALLDVRQHRVYDDRQLKHPSATQTLLPAKTGNSKDVLFGVPQKPNIFFNDSTTDNASQEETLQRAGKEIHYLTSQKESSASVNNLNKISNSEPKTEKPINTASLQHTCLSNIKSDTQEVQKLPASLGTSHSVCAVRFIKGILKKQSKYMSGDTTCVYGSGYLIFAKQEAVAIRDSVELTRAKTKEMGGNSTVKKKLRWFDEVQVEKEDKTQDIINQMKNKPSNLCQPSNNSEDHQLSLTTVSGGSRPGPSLTPPASTGYHFTKQAWADVGVQVSLPQERAEEVKVPWSSTRTDGPKVPRRERSSSRTRKGTVIRPQSATEVSQIAKTQGKIIMPRPPPRMELVEEKRTYITKTPYGMDHPSVNCKQALAVEQALHKDNSEGLFSPHSHHVIRTDSTVMYTPLPPSYTCPVSQGNMKGTPSSGHQEIQDCSRRRGMVHDEKGLCLDCTPTDEEISQLWHGVRSALTTKNENRSPVISGNEHLVDPKNFLPHNSLLSPLPQACANLFCAASNTDSLLIRHRTKTKLRRQALESGRVVRKPCVEQSRQPPRSGNRRFPQPSQPTKQITEPVRLPSSTYYMAFPDEGLSATQLHLAKVHAEGLLQERDSVAAMETGQTHRPGTVQERSQQQGLTTISLEEQKILLSLDRLNHQLLCVQEHVGDNTGTRGLVHIDRPSTREVKATNHHKHRASSANNHS